VVAASADTKVYDGGVTSGATPTIASGTLFGSDTASLSQVFANRNAGTGKTLNASASISDGNGGANYAVSFVPSTAGVITAAPLTVTARADTKVYDGGVSSSALPTITSGTLFGSDAASLSQVFANRNASTGKTLNASASISDGNSGANYAVTFVPSTSGVITPAPLTVTARPDTKVYDGGVSSSALPTITSGTLLGSDTASLSEAFANRNAGTGKTLNASATISDGNGGGNYTVSFVPSTTGVITPASLTLGGITANSRTYDATTNASVGGTPVLGGLIGTDAVTLSIADIRASFADKNVGTAKPVTISSITLGGADAGNYAFVPPTGLNANITPATLTVGGLSAAGKVYDATTAATVSGTASVAPLASDVVAVGGTPTGSFADKNVGVAKAVNVGGVTLTGADAGNYVLAMPALTADITAATLTVGGVAANSKVYDATPVATLSGTPVLTGALGADAVTLSTAGMQASFADKNVGVAKPVAVGGLKLAGADAGNYVLVAPSSLTADITQATLTIAGLVASDKAYDGTTAATLTGTPLLRGVLGSDSVTLNAGSASFADPNAGNGKPVIVAGLGLSGADAGNYKVAAAPLVANITPAPLTITARDRSKSEGSELVLGSGEFDVLGLVGTETLTSVTLASAGAPASAAAGSYPITAGNAAGAQGFLPANYAITYKDGLLSVQAAATPAPTTATAAAVNQVVTFAQSFVETAKAQEQEQQSSSPSTSSDGKKKGKDDVTVTDNSCKP
jgi:trimeric autotransporter adhesin